MFKRFAFEIRVWQSTPNSIGRRCRRACSIHRRELSRVAAGAVLTQCCLAALPGADILSMLALDYALPVTVLPDAGLGNVVGAFNPRS